MPSRSMMRREPFVDLFDIRRSFDDLFSRYLTAPSLDRWSAPGVRADWVPAVESYIDNNQFHVRMPLPGVKPEQVNLQVQGSELSISGERSQEVTPSEDRSFQREILYGAFERIIPLPDGVQSDKVEASYRNGVLEVSVPLSEKAVARKIEIKGLDQGKKLAA